MVVGNNEQPGVVVVQQSPVPTQRESTTIPEFVLEPRLLAPNETAVDTLPHSHSSGTQPNVNIQDPA
jgi:hypothetical protein